jgi:hypothetical protein
MSWLLVVLPGSAQADLLQHALRTRISDEIVVVGSIEEGLTSIEQNIPDVILLPTMIPAVEDYLVAYLATMPGARHVQILGIPCLEPPAAPLEPHGRSPLLWKRRQAPRPVAPLGCDPGVFAEDVVTYLARARELRAALAASRTDAASHQTERRSDPRFANHEVPWISVVRFGNERAVLLDVSSRGALLRTETRPEHSFLRRAAPGVRQRARLTLELASDQEVHAVGRVIRCVPSTTGPRTQYDVAFSFDESVGLHLPTSSALVHASSDDDDEVQVVPSLTRSRSDV